MWLKHGKVKQFIGKYEYLEWKISIGSRIVKVKSYYFPNVLSLLIAWIAIRKK